MDTCTVGAHVALVPHGVEDAAAIRQSVTEVVVVLGPMSGTRVDQHHRGCTATICCGRGSTAPERWNGSRYARRRRAGMRRPRGTRSVRAVLQRPTLAWSLSRPGRDRGRDGRDVLQGLGQAHRTLRIEENAPAERGGLVLAAHKAQKETCMAIRPGWCQVPAPKRNDEDEKAVTTKNGKPATQGVARSAAPRCSRSAEQASVRA